MNMNEINFDVDALMQRLKKIDEERNDLRIKIRTINAELDPIISSDFPFNDVKLMTDLKNFVNEMMLSFSSILSNHDILVDNHYISFGCNITGNDYDILFKNEDGKWIFIGALINK